MFVRLKNEDGFVNLVNLSQAQKIVPVQFEDKSMGIKVIWQHDTFKDFGEEDLPDDSCDYSEEIFVDITVQQVEQILARMGMVFAPAQPKQEVQPVPTVPVVEDAPETEEPAVEEKSNMEILQDGIDTIKEAKSKPIPEAKPAAEAPKEEKPAQEPQKKSRKTAPRSNKKESFGVDQDELPKG